MDLISFCKAENMKAGRLRNGIPDRDQAGFDLCRFQRHGAAECQIIVAHRDQPARTLGHAARGPALDDAHRGEAV
ncbi:hypothetical protein D3C80_1637590 [compost metagenome]